MKLSIITINYNNLGGLKKTVESLISQSMQDYEWIVIDGGSMDGSKELIERYAQYMAYHVSEPDEGIYHAMNKGIRASHGEYLMFLNSGDYLYDKTVVERVIPLLNDKDIYIGRIHSLGKDNTDVMDELDYSSIGIINKLSFSWIPHQASFFKRSVFEAYGMYREDLKIISDWWLYFRSLIMGKATIEAIPFTIANYDTTGISATRKSLTGEEFSKAMEDYPRMKELFMFYGRNAEMIDALHSNRVFFILFRFYFYIYRKLLRK